MAEATVVFEGQAWRGFVQADLLWFDYRAGDGRALRFFVFPDQSVMLTHRPWPPDSALYAEWLVHLVHVRQRDPACALWEVEDRQIDIIVEPDGRTYRVIDLGDFGQALEEHRLRPAEARRVLEATQAFLDRHLHGGGRFPPPALARWLEEAPQPELAPG